MSSFIFNDTVPAAPNNPSVDQTPMLNNNISNVGIWAVDHIGFNTANGGTHEQVTFVNNPNYITPPTPPSANTGIFYTGAGIAPTAAQLYFINSNVTVPASPIKAVAYVDSTGAIIASQSSNISTIVKNSTGNFSVTLTANAVTTNNFIVIPACTRISAGTSGLTINYAITGIGTFNLFVQLIGTPADPTSFNFIVIQL